MSNVRPHEHKNQRPASVTRQCTCVLLRPLQCSRVVARTCRRMSVAACLRWAGCLLALAGAFFASPLADLLPVNLWQTVNDVLRMSASSSYMKVVPGEQSNLLPWACIAVGVLAFLLGRRLERGVRNE
jgi:hypothetical protein